MITKLRTSAWVITLTALFVTACGDSNPVSAEGYADTDRLFGLIDRNVAESDVLERIVDIDHSRLGAEAGSVMPPTKVLIFSDPAFEADLLAKNLLTAIDLPLRILAYQPPAGSGGQVIFNSFDYLVSRYGLTDSTDLEQRFEETMAGVLRGVAPSEVSRFVTDSMQPDGIKTLPSPYSFQRSVERLTEAIDAQDDTVWFGTVDFKARAYEQGVVIPSATLLLFGGPAPGAKAMAEAQTLGLDGFCQKLLVWEDESGNVFASYNDLLMLAERQDVPKSLALRVINRRLAATFEGALEGTE